MRLEDSEMKTVQRGWETQLFLTKQDLPWLWGINTPRKLGRLPSLFPIARLVFRVRKTSHTRPQQGTSLRRYPQKPSQHWFQQWAPISAELNLHRLQTAYEINLLSGQDHLKHARVMVVYAPSSGCKFSWCGWEWEAVITVFVFVWVGGGWDKVLGHSPVWSWTHSPLYHLSGVPPLYPMHCIL